MKSSWTLHIILFFFVFGQLTAQEVTTDSIQQLNEKAFKLSRDYRFGTSLSLSHLAIQHAVNIKDERSLANSYHMLGYTYSRMQYPDRSREYYKKALNLFQKLKDAGKTIFVYQDLARLSIDTENYAEAIQYIQKGEEVAETTKNPEDKLVLQWAKIQYLQKQERYKEVINLVDEMQTLIAFNKTEPLYTARKNFLEFELGNTYYHLNEYDKALPYLEKHIQNEYAHVNFLATSYKQLADIYKAQGNSQKHKEALQNHIKYLTQKLQGDREKLLVELQTDDNFSTEKENLDALEEKNEAKKTIVNRFKVVLTIIILLLVVCLILGALLIKAIYKKIKSNRLLRYKHKKLEEAKRKAEMTSKTRSNFFSMMSHELRTPLYAVTGLTHLLLEDQPRDSQMQYLKSLKFSSDHLLSLVNNILQANKLEDNTITIGAATFNLKNDIDNIIKSFDLLIKERGNKIHVAYDNSIPEYLVGDSLKVSQILINLISNAIKFTKDGVIRVSVQKTAETEDDVQLHFRVQDTGIGIPKEKQEHVFEMFSQNHDTINEEYQGSGLGLSIVKKLLEVYGSTIQMESREHVGTTFSFDINFPKSLKAESKKVESNIENIDFSHLKMLVVDDNKINQMLTKKILSTKNIQVEVVSSGSDAVNAVKNNSFDIILMDIHMPEMDGYEATKAIRQFNKEVPVIAFTAVSLDESLHKIFNSGMNDMILKPFVASQLFAMIFKHMKK